MRKEIEIKIMGSSATQVVLDEMNIQDNEMAEIAQMIKQKKPQLKDIFLSNNNIGDAGASILAHELAVLPNLTSIDLQFNQLGKDGITAIMSLYKNHPNLNLALYGNTLSNAGEIMEIKESVMATFNNKLRF